MRFLAATVELKATKFKPEHSEQLNLLNMLHLTSKSDWCSTNKRRRKVDEITIVGHVIHQRIIAGKY